MDFFAATSNPGKLRDFAFAAEHWPPAGSVRIVPLPGLDALAAPPEDEPTFEGNARAKAIYYSRFAPGHLVLADDSGLEVRCLDNAPGVRSARFAQDQGFPHPPASTLDERNNAALLRAMDGIPDRCRCARYRCVLALARDSSILRTAEGELDGSILTAPRGARGFGYDPLFLLPEYGQTMAEADPALRIQLSHRGRAFRHLLEALQANPLDGPARSR